MSIKAAFLMEEVSIPLERLLPSRALPPGIKQSPRYLMIEASVREVGIIEPPIVYPQEGKEKDRMYLLLEGHLRVEVLRDLGRTHVECLVATDDENCTYNHHISGLAPIQEIRMIRKAVADGVPEERIAKALNVSVRSIKETETKLDGICAEAIEVLKDKPIVDRALEALKKVKPYRQVEMAELMRMANMYTEPHAKALLAATPPDQLVSPPKKERPEQMAKLEAEMRALERDFVVLEESYSRDTLNLQLARAYLKALLQNARVARYLGQKHAELLGQLQKVVDATSLEA